ncbi:MAG: ABC transporter substrate-binding protein [Lentilactobacillus hilgardii]|uniref:ABC transporter substrate-binding protein n=1 Tax=Lentilactobacillus hilgardii TaxID=1588 RepID=UPI001CC215DB|nr:ABC transporter substrate-binding protein [Lentilactobacillus hilgardii]MBZ2200192.1 ABC transporter substrate-binding protein [Lentilactobacillus hilgardii]MBZ2203233.1 ABC transporter substrate-binding protein [Lentilactobacillus hilgardii]
MNFKHVVKRFVGLISIMSVALLFAGCSKSAAHKVTHITYWHVNAQTLGGASVDKLVKKFNDTHKTIKVTAKYNPNMYQGLMQNLQSAQASGKVPDIVQIGWAFTNYFSDNFKYMTPTDAAQKFDKNKDTITKNFSNQALSFAKNAKGKLVGLPYSLSTPILYTNDSMLAKYGIKKSDLSTWEGVSKAAKTIKQKSGKYGVYIQEPADTWAQQAMMLSNGAQIKDASGKAAFASNQGEQAYQLYQDMVVKDKTAIHTPWNQGMDDFVNGKVAMAFTTVAQASHIKQSVSFKASAQTAPTFKAHKLTVPVGGSMLSITAQKTDQQKAAWTFEKFMYQNDSLLTWDKGTGYLPPTKTALDSSQFKTYLAANPMIKPAVDELPNAVPWTSFPKNGLQAEQDMIDARDKILSGSSVSSTLKSTQEKINDQQ